MSGGRKCEGEIRGHGLGKRARQMKRGKWPAINRDWANGSGRRGKGGGVEGEQGRGTVAARNRATSRWQAGSSSE